MEQLLTRIFDQAVANGWLGIKDLTLRYDGVIFQGEKLVITASKLQQQTWSFASYTQAIFTEEFAKAYFGTKFHHWVSFVHCSQCGVNYDSTETKMCWQYHLKQLTMRSDPLSYLEVFLK